MTDAAERHQQICDLVEEVLALESADRETFLLARCAGDPELAAEVRSLLAEEEALVDGFLEETIFEGGAIRRQSPQEKLRRGLTERIGPFRILRLLGEGGMGTVLLAEQDEPYRRRLALKVVHGLRTEGRRKRFVAECQALARLSHPNIAALYEAGTLDDPQMGRVPYVAMEWIDGEPITAWCDRHRLPVEARLRLFQGACAGVRHAHEKGVLHCDLKPANMLVTEVDGEPVAKIIDFGIARAFDEPLLDETRFTQLGLAGSPAFMSPEALTIEAGGDLDTRSDVYSLGLVLYRLVSGFLPFDLAQKTLWTYVEHLRDNDPPTLLRRFERLSSEEQEEVVRQRRSSRSMLRRQLGGDLNAIILKAIERNPGRRYGSPADFAADLGRFLRREPVEARAPSLPYVTLRFLRRRWKGALAVTLLALALVVGFVARTFEARRANAEAARAQQEAARAQAALQDAEELSDFLVNLFRIADPEQRGSAATVLDLLEQGVETLRVDLATQPVTRARFLRRIGQIYTSLALLDRAEACLREGLELLPGDSEQEIQERARVMSALGVVLRRTGSTEEAEEVLRQSLEQWESLDSPPILELAQALSHLGNLYWATNRSAEAEAAHRRALDLRTREPFDPSSLGESHNNLGVMLRTAGRWEEAREHLIEAQRIYTELHGGDHPQTIASRYNRAFVEQRLGGWSEAQQLLESSFERWKQHYGLLHPRTLSAFRSLMMFYRVSDRQNHAIRFAEAQLAELQLAEATPRQRSILLLSYAIARTEAGDVAAAGPIFEELLASSREELGPENRTTLRDESNFAWWKWRNGEYAEAERIWRSVIERRRAIGEDDTVGRVLSYLGIMAREQGRLAEAEELLRSSLVLLDAAPASVANADAVFALGELLAVSRPADAESLLRQAVELRTVLLPPGHRDLQEAEASLARLSGAP
ncbi:MAG: serine/threonine-protein kinase [Acidobacteriota bacterium]